MREQGTCQAIMYGLANHHITSPQESLFSIQVQTTPHEIIRLQLPFCCIVQQSAMSEFEESEDYAPEGDRSQSQPEGEQVYKRRIEKYNQNSIEGKWTEQENLRYILYMDAHYKIFVSKEKRKSERIFKSLSDFLVTRTPRQCRSHFQKIMNKFGNLRKVRQFYQEELGASNYQARLEEVAGQVRRKDIKTEETEAPKCISLVHTEVQTDALSLRLADLSNGEVMKLMSLLYEYQKIQIPLPMWVAHEKTSIAKEKEIE